MHAWLAIIGLLAVGPVDFDADVMPILTHAGCNAAACHGAAAGRGGLALSLYGARPADDYNAIVRQLKGRRLNFREPQNSLLLAKPTGELEHGGDVRLDADGPHAAAIAQWILEGARHSESPQLVGLEVTASQTWFAKLPAEGQLTPIAIFADGERRDVRELAVYASADDSAAEISASGVVKLLRPGRQIITVRYATQVTALTLTSPLNAEPVDFAAAPRANFVDEELYATLGELRLPASPPADDAALLRRARLDFTGRLPTPEEVDAFLANESIDKRTKLIDRLLASDDFNDYWTHRLATWLRIGAPGSDARAARTYYDWLHAAVASGEPLDELARALVTGDGDTHAVGPANFYRAAGDARGQAEYFSEVLLGVRLRCANCHNHPLDRWTQDDYHGLAAMFAQLDRSQMIRFVGRGEVSHPATGEAALPRIPGERNLSSKGDHREVLAAWLVDEHNPYFAQAMVNRFWSALLGRGLVEPVDDFRATNPPTHPVLLEKLTADFVEHRYDLRHTLRTIALSSAYERATQPLAANRSDDRYYSHALAKPLSPEVRLDAIRDIVGAGGGRAARAINFIGAAEPAPVGLAELGRCPRTASCEAAGATTSGLAQQLALLNGRLLNEPLARGNGRIAQFAELPDEQLVSRVYLLALSRPPTENEQTFWRRELRDAATAERRAVVEDLVWSLLNCDEFVHNH